MVNPVRALTALLSRRTNVAPAPTDHVSRVAATGNPLAGVEASAAWIVCAGLLIATGLFLGNLVLVRGRSRSWRPGDPGTDG
jgi:hypothetical protein